MFAGLIRISKQGAEICSNNNRSRSIQKQFGERLKGRFFIVTLAWAHTGARKHVNSMTLSK